MMSLKKSDLQDLANSTFLQETPTIILILHNDLENVVIVSPDYFFAKNSLEIVSDGTRAFLLESEHPVVIAAQERMKKDYQRDLRDQIEHKRRMRDLEERRRIEEEKLEELRIRK